jgi:hypothetical protein
MSRQHGNSRLNYKYKQTKTLPNNVSFINPPYAQLSLVLLTYINQSTALTSLQQPTRQLLEHIDAYYVMSDQSPHKAYISTTLSDYAAAKQLHYFTQ